MAKKRTVSSTALVFNKKSAFPLNLPGRQQQDKAGGYADSLNMAFAKAPSHYSSIVNFDLSPLLDENDGAPQRTLLEIIFSVYFFSVPTL